MPFPDPFPIFRQIIALFIFVLMFSVSIFIVYLFDLPTACRLAGNGIPSDQTPHH